MGYDIYRSPFTDRYGTEEMRVLFSDNYRYTVWRDLWYALAKAEKLCGVHITQEQLNEIYDALDANIDYDAVKKYEEETRHDVMAHLLEFGDHCPTARGILHLGATSCYITDNSDIFIMRSALHEVKIQICIINGMLRCLADKYEGTPIVGRTHLQKAQLTTIGKRICMWINDLMLDYDMINDVLDKLRLLGCKGATGSQSSLYTMFDGDYDKARELDRMIGAHFGMPVLEISGQTYTRKYDSMIANVLSQVAQSASKFATDMRLMSEFGEMYEKFGKKQVGSSAMPYKRNPITCEKVCGISRFVICNAQNTAITASTQWLERTLDDSSNRRIVMAELFLATSEILKSMHNVIETMTINEDVCVEHAKEHAKMASLEDDIVKKVMNGADRQDCHRDAVWSDGSDDVHINVGFAPQQVREFLRRTYR